MFFFLLFFLSSLSSLPAQNDSAYLKSDPALYHQSNSQSLIEVDGVNLNAECAVPCDQIFRGAAKDAIPSIDNPKYVDSKDSTAPSDDVKVIGIVIDGKAIAYPYNILTWHEIVNDVYNGQHFSVTYCPLTASGILYKTDVLNGSELGTSGYLFENNLVFYDRESSSYWSQMKGLSIKGNQIGTEIEYSEAIETNWKTWKKLYPDTLVLSTDTGDKPYYHYPYGEYETDQSIYFPSSYSYIENPYQLFHEKTLAQIIEINDDVLLLPFEELAKANLLNFNFSNTPLVTFFLEDEQLSLTYLSNFGNSSLIFEPASSAGLSSSLTYNLPVFKDRLTDSIWNIRGVAIEGTMRDTKLTLYPSYNAFWFAATTFHPNATVLLYDELSENIEYISFSVNPTYPDSNSLSGFTNLLSIIAIFTILVSKKLTMKKRLSTVTPNEYN